jgi:hypothetical protein
MNHPPEKEVRVTDETTSSTTATSPLPDPMEGRVAAFVEAFRQASAALDAEAQRELFAETFLAGDSNGAAPVPRESFLQAVPARAAAAKEVGVGRAALTGSSMLRLDGAWVLLRTEWSAPLADGGELPMTSTFLLHDSGSDLRIAAYLNHRGLPLRRRS